MEQEKPLDFVFGRDEYTLYDMSNFGIRQDENLVVVIADPQNVGKTRFLMIQEDKKGE